jgi:hypothetical protein
MTFCEMHKPSGCGECPNRFVCPNSTIENNATRLLEVAKKQEAFINAGCVCFILEENPKEKQALILTMGNNTLQYVVAMGFQRGATEWDSGKYFTNIAGAVEWWKAN